MSKLVRTFITRLAAIHHTKVADTLMLWSYLPGGIMSEPGVDALNGTLYVKSSI